MEDRRYFCLRGFMKSGTNWLGSLLSSHEYISVVGEYHWQDMMEHLQRNFRRHPVYENPEYQKYTLTQFEQMVKNVLDHAVEHSARVVGERTPHRIEPLIIRDAPIISIIRDGRDVLVSRAFHLHNYPGCHRLFERLPEMNEDHQKFKRDPWFFRNNPGVLLRHELMVRESVGWWREHLVEDEASVKKHPRLQVKFIRYEDLHRETERSRKDLFEFLDVDPSRASDITGHLTPGFDVEQPTEFFRKGAVGDWTNYFTNQTREWFKEEAGEQLIRYGYEADYDW